MDLRIWGLLLLASLILHAPGCQGCKASSAPKSVATEKVENEDRKELFKKSADSDEDDTEEEVDETEEDFTGVSQNTTYVF